MNKQKTIKYRGGIAEFSIPAHWREEYEPQGGGTFYEDSPESGTLRLNVLSFESKDTPAEQMAATAFREGFVTRTVCGFPLCCEEKIVDENGKTLHITTWEVAVPVPPKSLRLAIFSYTILLSQKQDASFIAELDALHRSIKEAGYSQESGEAGEYEHA